MDPQAALLPSFSKMGVGLRTVTLLRLSLKRNPRKLVLMSSRLLSMFSPKSVFFRLETWVWSSQQAWNMYLGNGVISRNGLEPAAMKIGFSRR